MSKSADEVVQYVLKNMGEHAKVAERVVRDLRVSGWLRTSPYAESASEERIAQLERELAGKKQDAAEWHQNYIDMTRERDEALNTTYALRGIIHDMQDERTALRATAASPEVMRLVKAVQEYKEEVGDFSSASGATVWGRLALAVNALPLSASRQPKAQEPRYRVVADAFGHTVKRSDAALGIVAGFWHQTDTLAQAEAMCARLNGEGGAS